MTDDEIMLMILKKEERRLENAYSHLSYTPHNLKQVQDAIRERGGYRKGES